MLCHAFPGGVRTGACSVVYADDLVPVVSWVGWSWRVARSPAGLGPGPINLDSSKPQPAVILVRQTFIKSIIIYSKAALPARTSAA